MVSPADEGDQKEGEEEENPAERWEEGQTVVKKATMLEPALWVNIVNVISNYV